MKTRRTFLPSFKATSILVGTLNIIFASSMFARGVMNGMAQFKVPTKLLASAHYADAMFFVFLHQFMMGVLLILMGMLAENPVKQVWAARVLVLVHGVYAYFDLQTSDNYFGNALYQGPSSVIPVVIDVLYMLLFLRLSFRRRAKKPVELANAY